MMADIFVTRVCSHCGQQVMDESWYGPLDRPGGTAGYCLACLLAASPQARRQQTEG